MITNDQPCARRIPLWGWVLAGLTFPAGMFVALGFLRILPWKRSVFWALLSEATVFVFGTATRYLENQSDNALLQLLIHQFFVIVSLLIGLGWALTIYRKGQAARSWSLPAQQVWRIAGWCAAALFGLGLIGFARAYAILRIVQQ